MVVAELVLMSRPAAERDEVRGAETASKMQLMVEELAKKRFAFGGHRLLRMAIEVNRRYLNLCIAPGSRGFPNRLSYLWQLLEQRLPARPCFVARFAICLTDLRIVRLAGPHEAVPSAFVNDRLIFLAGGFHELFRFRNCRVNA